MGNNFFFLICISKEFGLKYKHMNIYEFDSTTSKRQRTEKYVTIAKFISTFLLAPLPLKKPSLISTTVIDAMHSCTLQSSNCYVVL